MADGQMDHGRLLTDTWRWEPLDQVTQETQERRYLLGFSSCGMKEASHISFLSWNMLNMLKIITTITITTMMQFHKQAAKVTLETSLRVSCEHRCKGIWG